VEIEPIKLNENTEKGKERNSSGKSGKKP